MASEKISQLTNGNPAQGTDLIPIARSGSNFSVTPASIAALSAIDLQTDGVDNTDQAKLNLKTGSGISLSSDGSGGVTISGTVDTNIGTFAFHPWMCWVSDPDGIGSSNITAINTAHGTTSTGSSSLVRTAPGPLFNRYTSSGSAGSSCSNRWTFGSGGATNMPYGDFRRMIWRVRPVTTNDTRYWMTINGDNSLPFNSGLMTNLPNTDLAGFRFSPNAGDTHWMVVCQTDSSHSHVFDTGIAPDTSNAHAFEVKWDGATTMSFWYDGTLLVSYTTDLPPVLTSNVFDSMVSADNQGAAVAVSEDFLMAYVEWSVI